MVLHSKKPSYTTHHTRINYSPLVLCMRHNLVCIIRPSHVLLTKKNTLIHFYTNAYISINLAIAT